MTIPEKQSFVSVPDGKIFYRVFGSGSKPPLLCIHGGPGGTHNLLLPLKGLATQRPVILYDQLGCGQSPVDKDKSKQPGFWTIDRFFADIEAIKADLNITEWSIFGTSYGTMLLADYLLTKPSGVKSIIMSGPCLSAPLWKRDADFLLKQLPDHVQAILKKT